jgi:hypothetical protein
LLTDLEVFRRDHVLHEIAKTEARQDSLPEQNGVLEVRFRELQAANERAESDVRAKAQAARVAEVAADALSQASADQFTAALAKWLAELKPEPDYRAIYSKSQFSTLNLDVIRTGLNEDAATVSRKIAALEDFLRSTSSPAVRALLRSVVISATGDSAEIRRAVDAAVQPFLDIRVASARALSRDLGVSPASLRRLSS